MLAPSLEGEYICNYTSDLVVRIASPDLRWMTRPHPQTRPFAHARCASHEMWLSENEEDGLTILRSNLSKPRSSARSSIIWIHHYDEYKSR